MAPIESRSCRPACTRCRSSSKGSARSPAREFRIAVGFTATINVELNPAGVQENITVSGASPVVDLASTKVSTEFGAEKLGGLIGSATTPRSPRNCRRLDEPSVGRAAPAPSPISVDPLRVERARSRRSRRDGDDRSGGRRTGSRLLGLGLVRRHGDQRHREHRGDAESRHPHGRRVEVGRQHVSRPRVFGLPERQAAGPQHR